MSKMSLTEATMLALQGKLVENKTTKRPTKKLKKENIDINVDDKTNVSVMNNETIVDTEDATIIVDKKEDEFVPETSDGIVTDTSLPMEAPVDTVEVPLEGDETIVPDETTDTSVEEPTETTDVEPDVDLPLETEEPIEDEEKEESKKIETKKEFKFESKKLQEEITDEVKACAEQIADVVRERGILNFTEVDDMICEILGISYEEARSEDQDLVNDVYGCMTYYEGLNLNYSTGDFYTDEYAKSSIQVGTEVTLAKTNASYSGCTGKVVYISDTAERPYVVELDDGRIDTFTADELVTELMEESKEIKKEEIDIEIADDGKSVEVTTDDGEEVTVKDETPDENENDEEIETEPTETEIPEDDEVFEESKKLNEEVTDDILVKIEPRYLIGKDGKHYDQTVFFKVTYKVYKGNLIPMTEEIVGWCWGETDKYDEASCNLKADYNDTVKPFVNDIDKGNTANYQKVSDLGESKKLNEDYSAAPFRDYMYDCMKDDIEPADVMVDRMLSAWSDDDCKWYCETYELLEPYKDYSDEDQYYKDLYGNIRDISGQINEDAELEEAKKRRVESVKKIEARNRKKFENVTRTKKVECDGKTCNGKNCKEKTEYDDKKECNTITNINEKLEKALKVEKIENVKIEEANGKILLKAKVINENKTKGICFVMNTLTENEKFVKFDLHEIKSLKVENKKPTQKFTMLAHKNNNVLECRYIIKK